LVAFLAARSASSSWRGYFDEILAAGSVLAQLNSNPSQYWVENRVAVGFSEDMSPKVYIQHL
jgi:hypothetical protein